MKGRSIRGRSRILSPLAGRLNFGRRLPYRLALVPVLAALLLVPGCQRAPEAAPRSGEPIRIGAYYWPGQFWVDIAQGKGWFKEAGLTVEWVDTNADYFGSLEDLVDGRLDIACFTLFDLLRYYARGAGIVGFIASDQSSGSEALVARPGVDRVRDLSGARVGVSKGTYLEYLWTVVSEREGLDPGAVQVVDISPERAAQSLVDGSVDAVFTWEPFAGQALSAARGKKLFDTSQLRGALWAIFAARREFLDRRAADVAALTRVWQRATAYLQEHPDEALAAVAEINGKSVADAREFMKLDLILDLHENKLAFSFAPGFDSLHGTARRMNDFLIEQGTTTRRVDTAKMLDSSFISDLKPAGAVSSPPP